MRSFLFLAQLSLCLLPAIGGHRFAVAGDTSPPIRDPEHRIQRAVMTWKELKQRNIVMQRRDFSCGAAALATLIRYYWGDNVTEQTFLVALDTLLTAGETRDRIQNGLTLTDLRRAAVKTGYQATLGELTFQKLTESKVPLVVGITVRDYKHFVVYRGFDGALVYLADPIRGNIRLPAGEFQEQWQANAVLVVAKPGEKIKETSPLSVRFEEIVLGELNKDMVEKTYLKTPAPFPTLLPR
jgi:predicted double-glycine peptidase